MRIVSSKWDILMRQRRRRSLNVFLSADNSANQSLEAISPSLIYNYCFYSVMKQWHTVANLTIFKLFFSRK